MDLGTYVDGRTLGYDEASREFAIGGVPVTAEQVRAYSGAEQIHWGSDAVREWFATSFPPPAPPPSTTAPAPVVAVAAVGGKKPKTGLVLALVAGMLLLACAVFAAIGSSTNDTKTPTAPSTSVTPAPSTAPSSVASTSAASAPAVTEPEVPAPTEPTPAPKPRKKVYKTLSARAFKKLAKNPDAYIGRTYIVYGEVTQFDSATGTDVFRADTGSRKLRPSYGYVDYSQNTMLTGSEKRLADIVEGDLFKARVTVLGSFSYDTQIGGSTTVPNFRVDGISVYGNVD